MRGANIFLLFTRVFCFVFFLPSRSLFMDQFGRTGYGIHDAPVQDFFFLFFL